MRGSVLTKNLAGGGIHEEGKELLTSGGAKEHGRHENGARKWRGQWGVNVMWVTKRTRVIGRLALTQPRPHGNNNKGYSPTLLEKRWDHITIRKRGVGVFAVLEC